jgi:hypothetical protein
MVSSFYSSNQKKQKDYIKSRYLQEQNDTEQQDRVDYTNAIESNLDTKATNLSKLATRVVNKIGSEILPYNQGKLTSNQYTPMQLLTNSINNGKLTQLFEKLKALPNSLLNKTQRLIRDDLNNSENKKQINYQIEDASANGPDAIANAVIQSMGGIGNENLILDMIDKTSEKLDELKVNEIKNQKKETKLMRKEDSRTDVNAWFSSLNALLTLKQNGKITNSQRTQISQLRNKLRRAGYTNEDFNTIIYF